MGGIDLATLANQSALRAGMDAALRDQFVKFYASNPELQALAEQVNGFRASISLHGC